MKDYYYEDFEAWFHETEGLSTRSERCYDEYEMTDSIHPYKTVRKWLEAAFYAGRMQTSYVVEIEDDGRGPFITFPKELSIQQNWREGTIIDWQDNGDGSWTLKAK